MLISQETGDVTRSTGLYYICSIAILLIVAVVSFSVHFMEMRVTILLCFAGGVVLWQVFQRMSAAGANKTAAELRGKLLSKRKQDTT